jgi:hypothetical protein
MPLWIQQRRSIPVLPVRVGSKHHGLFAARVLVLMSDVRLGIPTELTST